MIFLVFTQFWQKKNLQFPAKTFFFGLHLILAKKHFNFRRKPFFGVHSILVTELRNLHYSTLACQMCLVKAEKASPHAKFYNLSAAQGGFKPRYIRFHYPLFREGCGAAAREKIATLHDLPSPP